MSENIDDLLDYLDINANSILEVEELEGVDSVGDLLTRMAGQMPIAGSVFVWEGIRFKILAADATRIIRVSVERVEPTIATVFPAPNSCRW